MLDNFENYGRIKRFVITILLFVVSSLVMLFLISQIRTSLVISVAFSAPIKLFVIPTVTGENIVINLYTVALYSVGFLIFSGVLTGLFAKTRKQALISLLIAIVIIIATVGSIKAVDASNERNYIKTKQDAIALKDASVCEKIPTITFSSPDLIERYSKYRTIECYTGISFALNQNLCDKAKDRYVIEICTHRFVLGVVKGKSPVPPNITLDTCEQSSNIVSKAICYQDFGIRKQDPDVCDKITPLISQDVTLTKNRNNCYRQVAIAKQDPSICGKIPGDVVYERNYCYSEIAVAKEDPAICGNITGSFTINSCYEKIAIAKKDTSICENILDEDLKTRCRDEVTSGYSLP